jgi:hypothetical protein
MLSLQDFNNSKNVKSLVQKLFEARQTAHSCHLSTKSYAEHKALQGFYEGMVDLADNFVETYQGQYGLIGDIVIQTKSADSPIEYLEECSKIFKAGREYIKDAHLQNILDEVVSLTYRTIYKIKNLK